MLPALLVAGLIVGLHLWYGLAAQRPFPALVLAVLSGVAVTQIPSIMGLSTTKSPRATYTLYGLLVAVFLGLGLWLMALGRIGAA